MKRPDRTIRRDQRGTGGTLGADVVRLYRGYFDEGMTVLDVGCGRGDMLGSGWIGIDLDISNKGEGSVVRGDLDDGLPFGDSVFDGVLCKDIIEHLPRPQDVLGELARVSRPGAKLLVLTPRAVPRAVWADHTHLRGFTRSSLVRLLEMTGWGVSSIGRMGGLPLAGRLHLTQALPAIMKVPGVGHFFGTNWQAIAVRKP